MTSQRRGDDSPVGATVPQSFVTMEERHEHFVTSFMEGLYWCMKPPLVHECPYPPTYQRQLYLNGPLKLCPLSVISLFPRVKRHLLTKLPNQLLSSLTTIVLWVAKTLLLMIGGRCSKFALLSKTIIRFEMMWSL
jgi:hypothetical protein